MVPMKPEPKPTQDNRLSPCVRLFPVLPLFVRSTFSEVFSTRATASIQSLSCTSEPVPSSMSCGNVLYDAGTVEGTVLFGTTQSDCSPTVH